MTAIPTATLTATTTMTMTTTATMIVIPTVTVIATTIATMTATTTATDPRQLSARRSWAPPVLVNFSPTVAPRSDQTRKAPLPPPAKLVAVGGIRA